MAFGKFGKFGSFIIAAEMKDLQGINYKLQ